GIGAGAVAAAVAVGLAVADPPADAVAERPPVPVVSPAPPPDLTPLPTPRADPAVAARPQTPPAAEHLAAAEPDGNALRAAEIWADLSTPDHAEKTHEEDARRRQWLRDLHPGRPAGGFQAP
ncbi:MAG: hypothetical protein K2X82_17255, partial [Gemmataceae bacterium]|nr:hypothetical protein [Gemmataceae bacterium]